ncbi:MAG TPA: hypothetical protein GX708_11085 [Gallicola sp.]|nr:hypothetical protein [Gallicola sp.]
MNIAKYITLIILLKFIILLTFMFIVRKYIKKKTLKTVLTIVICLLTIWTIMFTVDINRTNSLKNPIFARENGYMGSMTRYDGLGYKIGLEKNANTDQVSYGQMTILGRLVAGGVQDFINEFTIIDETEVCDQALEEIYRDDEYIYYLPCIKSSTIFLKYNNGEKTNIKKALDGEKVTIDKLIKEGLNVYKEPIQN